LPVAPTQGTTDHISYFITFILFLKKKQIMTCLGVELDTATLRIRPIAILVSAELTIPIK